MLDNLITLKAGVKLPGCLWGAVSQWPEHLQLKQEILGSIPGDCPVFLFVCLFVFLFFSSSSWLANFDGMKDL